jgi:hypothetical protein
MAAGTVGHVTEATRLLEAMNPAGGRHRVRG